MKKVCLLFFVFVMLFSVAACTKVTPVDTSSERSKTEAQSAPENVTVSEPTQALPIARGQKILVAYFSATGTTKRIAQMVASVLKADLYEIVPMQPYTAEDLNYSNRNSRATQEMSKPEYRPAIDGSVENMAEYDVVFIGFPIWWGEAPRIISTFAESYNFSGKTVVTFCTSGSSKMNDGRIKSLVNGAKWITGLRFDNDTSRYDIKQWISEIEPDMQNTTKPIR